MKPSTSGRPRSETKEEAKPGDIHGGSHPVASARAPKAELKLRVMSSGSRTARWSH